MAFHRVSLEGRPIKFLRMPLGEFTHVPWKPSVYQGGGTENRVNIQFKVFDAQREALETIEESIRDQLGIHASAWNSSVKPDAEGGGAEMQAESVGAQGLPGLGRLDYSAE